MTEEVYFHFSKVKTFYLISKLWSLTLINLTWPAGLAGYRRLSNKDLYRDSTFGRLANTKRCRNKAITLTKLDALLRLATLFDVLVLGTLKTNGMSTALQGFDLTSVLFLLKWNEVGATINWLVIGSAGDVLNKLPPSGKIKEAAVNHKSSSWNTSMGTSLGASDGVDGFSLVFRACSIRVYSTSSLCIVCSWSLLHSVVALFFLFFPVLCFFSVCVLNESTCAFD